MNFPAIFLMCFLGIASLLIGPLNQQPVSMQVVATDASDTFHVFSPEQTPLVNKASGKKKGLRKKNPIDEYRSANRNAVLGFAFGLASVLLFPLLGIAGLIFSNEAIRADRKRPGILQKGNRTLAYAGKVLSIIGLVITVLAILYLAFIIALLTQMGG